MEYGWGGQVAKASLAKPLRALLPKKTQYASWATKGKTPSKVFSRPLSTSSRQVTRGNKVLQTDSTLSGRKQNSLWVPKRTMTVKTTATNKKGSSSTVRHSTVRRGHLTESGRRAVKVGLLSTGTGTAVGATGTALFGQKKQVTKAWLLPKGVISSGTSQHISMSGNKDTAKKAKRRVVGKSLELGWGTQVSKADPDQADVAIMGRPLKKKRARIR